MTLLFILIGVYALGCMSGYAYWGVVHYDSPFRDKQVCSSHSQLTIYHQRSRN